MANSKFNFHSHELKNLRITREIYQQMVEHVRKESPREACGLLGGSIKQHMIHAQLLFPMKNILNSRVRYRIDPIQQFQAFNQIKTSNLELVGIYHSHPTGPNTPSILDIQEAYYPDAAYLIWSNQSNEWRLFVYLIQNGEYQEIGVDVS